MQNKNKKLTILVAVLLLGIGSTFAYFLGKTVFSGAGATTSATTATINNSTLVLEGEIEFNDPNMYPGHETISKIKATATGQDELIIYNLTWRGSNALNTPLEFTAYRVETAPEEEITINCEVKTEIKDGTQHLSEECTKNNANVLTNIVGKGTIPSNKDQQTINLSLNEFITATENGTSIYYYVVLKYPNEEKDQYVLDKNGNFDGTLEAVLSDTEADVNIVGVYLNDKPIKEIPKDSNYTFDSTKSSCDKNATLEWNSEDSTLTINNLTESGTNCKLYFKSNE